MGGDMQAQGHVQMMLRMVDYGQNPQAAADAPRWKVFQGRQIAVEHARARRRSWPSSRGADTRYDTPSAGTWSSAQHS